MLKTYVLNLDRHAKRLETIGKDLDRQGMKWQRFSGIDATAVPPEYLDTLVARRGPIPRMPAGARACTAGHKLILEDFVNSDSDHALVLEDDAEVSNSLARDLPILVEAFPNGILNLNRQPSLKSQKTIFVRRKNQKS